MVEDMVWSEGPQRKVALEKKEEEEEENKRCVCPHSLRAFIC